jgi:sulfur relay (sulfurtransferase) DsrF/TusC family protein
MKRVVVLVRRPPLARSATTEALRMAVGMTLGDHEVTVLYIDDGAGAAAELQPELAGGADIGEALSLFGPCHVREVVESGSLEQAHVAGVRKGIERMNRPAALSLLDDADVLLAV